MYNSKLTVAVNSGDGATYNAKYVVNSDVDTQTLSSCYLYSYAIDVHIFETDL